MMLVLTVALADPPPDSESAADRARRQAYQQMRDAAVPGGVIDALMPMAEPVPLRAPLVEVQLFPGELDLSRPKTPICAAMTPRDRDLELLLVDVFPEHCRILLPVNGHTEVTLAVEDISSHQAAYSTADATLAACLVKSGFFFNTRHLPLEGTPKRADYNYGAACDRDPGLGGAGTVDLGRARMTKPAPSTQETAE